MSAASSPPVLSPQPIPPPNNRRGSGASSIGGLPENHARSDLDAQTTGFRVGGPPGSPSPLAMRACNSPSAEVQRPRQVRVPPDLAMLEYVKPPARDLICLICHSAYVDPRALGCEHVFCKICLCHTWVAQPAETKTCPTCRHEVDNKTEPRAVPRFLESMLGDLDVQCPNTKLGCKWVDKRANVYDHVMLYCEHSLVECPAPTCRFPISYKDFDKGCLHYTVYCDYCQVSLFKSDLEEHQRNACAKRQTTCPDCAAELLRLDLEAHAKDVCPKAIISCAGTIVGCTVTAERTIVVEHEKGCPMAIMAPRFKEQQDRLERSEERIEPLERKVYVLEKDLDTLQRGFTNIKNLLDPNSNDSFPVVDPLGANSGDGVSPLSPPRFVPTPDFRLPEPSFPQVPVSSDRSTNTVAPPPFDSQIHHLLTLYESLQAEVSRIEAERSAFEGRTNMHVINENQRLREEMHCMRGAFTSMQAQMHWIVSSRLRSSNSAGSSSTGNSSTTASSSARSSTQGATHSPGPRSAIHSALHRPTRRLSDSTRQETKL